MAFYIQGLNTHDLMPLDKVFKNRVVKKTEAIIAEREIGQHSHHDNKEKGYKHRGAEVYQSVGALPQGGLVVAAQIMRSPVVILNPQSIVADALFLFHEKEIRHLPVVSTDGLLLGMLSERDVLRHLSGLTEDYQQQISRNREEYVTALMKSPVLTASADTDVRYVARLFVEQRVGALPIVTDSKLRGIITRSDVLTAVTRHFVLELWA